MQSCGIVMAIMTLGGCLSEEAAPAPLPPNREVAIYYQVQNPTGIASCYRHPTASGSRMVRLSSRQIVTIATSTTKLIREGSNYWLEVYPPLSHRPTCFMNTKDLLPLPNPH